jgi:metallo-beta-lactamase family protein
MIVQFLGATRSVTGSMHLITVNGKQILLDCGLFQGRRAETYDRNKNFPFEPASIDAVVLSHAHIDHAGNLPNLVKRGFSGPIYCTPATADLCRIMLMDSAHIQEKDVEFINKKHAKKKLPPVEPLYTSDDTQRTLELLREIRYRTPFAVADGVSAQYFDAGHILGSGSVHLTIQEVQGKEKHFGFTGDVGRPNMPILRDPEFMGNVDALICESTYGGRFHEGPNKIPDDIFLDVVKRTVERGGKIIVPSFSVGRTQDFVYKLNNLKNAGKLPDIPVFVDSPLSTNATAVFRKHTDCFNDKTIAIMKSDDDIFGFDRLHYIRNVEESKQLNERTGPFIIISASGMCEAGRIVHHLYNNIENPKNTVMIIGYQAAHTLGRKIVERYPEVTMFGESLKLNAEVVVLNSFSAHADGNELLAYVERFDKQQLKNIFLVHGDYDQSQKFSAALMNRQFKRVDIPERLEKFEM